MEKKRSIAATPPHIVAKVVRDKKLATTTNDDVTSPLSTASLATCPALPRMEWAQSKELLEPTIENNDEDDDSNDDGDGGGKCDGEFNKVAKMAVKSSDVDDDYSNDDGDDGVNDGSDGSGKFIVGGGKYIPSGKGLYYPDDDAFLDDIFDDDYVEKHFSSIPDEKACDRNRNRIMGGPQTPRPNATEEEKKSYERKRKALLTPIVASYSPLCPLWT